MKINSFILNLTSDDPDRLRTFYREVVGFTPQPDMGEGTFALAPGVFLAIDTHSETSGKAKEPQRALIDFTVDDLKAEQARLKAQGVEFIREEGKEEWGGVISTFLDPDGNYCQLIEFKG